MATHNPAGEKTHDIVLMEQAKGEDETIEHSGTADDVQYTSSKAGMPVMRSKADDLTVWQSVRRYKFVSLIAMVAAFSASLDGYRKHP